MSDEELRQSLEQAHRADSPASFGAVLGRKRQAQRTRIPAFAAFAGLGAVALVLIAIAASRSGPPRRPPPLRIAQSGLAQTPLDFLLQPQGRQFFSETPRFDARGLP